MSDYSAYGSNGNLDYSKLEYNPIGLGDKDMLWDKYPALLSNHVFSLLKREDMDRGLDERDLSNLLSFVILYVDQDSPFYKVVDLEERMADCFRPLGISKGHIVWNEVEQHSKLYSDILYDYFRMKNSILFNDWLSLKTNLEGFYKILKSPIDVSETEREAVNRSTIVKNIKGLKRDVMEAEVKLFPNKGLQDLINREAYKKTLTGFAEKYAQSHPALRDSA